MSTSSVFDNLEALRLSPDAAATAGTKEVLRHVPVRKPNRTEFVRVHPDADMQLATGVFIDREEREVFFVVPELRVELAGELKPVLLATAISRQGVVILWPVPLPDAGGRRNAWAETAREACEMGKRAWVRLVPDMSLGAYRIYEAEGQLSAPMWPDKALSELLKLGFKDRIIDSADHPVVRRLRGLALIPFREAWACDFEFRALPGERPWPVCMVAREQFTGREIRLWRDDLLKLRKAPFNTGADAVIVAYYASAELGCFLELGWPLPANMLDLYAEHRCETNGMPTPCGDGLVGALALRGLAHIDAGEKEAMRRLVMDNITWSDAEQAAILDYCASDVTALSALLPRMAPTIDWPRALLRGRYMAAVARMERAGVPIDTTMRRRIADQLGRHQTAARGRD